MPTNEAMLAAMDVAKKWESFAMVSKEIFYQKTADTLDESLHLPALLTVAEAAREVVSASPNMDEKNAGAMMSMSEEAHEVVFWKRIARLRAALDKLP